MPAPPESAAAAEGLAAGDAHYRAFIGPPDKYDVVSAMQFNLMTALGLLEHHSLLDIGCGSLRAGRLFLMYLLPDRYFGIEPEAWLVQEGIDREIGPDLIDRKRPTVLHDRDFGLEAFGCEFDFLIAQSVFSHTSKAQLEHCLEQASRVMHERSLFAATYVRGDTDYAGTDWVYPGCVRPAYIQEAAAAYGLVARDLEWPHPSAQTWTVFAKREEAIPTVADASRIAYLEQEVARSRARIERLEERPLRKLQKNVKRAARKLLGRS